MRPLIMIIEDEHDIVSTLEYNLQREGFATRVASSGDVAFDLTSQAPLPDLVLLDLMLPGTSGTELCRRLRASEQTRAIPIIMLTAKTDEIDKVVGFEVGADDYVTKPFSVRELLLRVRAILRRRAAEQEPEATELRFGELRVDEAAHRVWIGRQEASLTALEFRLLATLLARKGRVQTRDTLLSDVWGIDAELTTRTVDTHVKRLREKLGDAGEYIETLRGVGYRFRSAPNATDD